jgi:RNA polymerase sigma-70 factor (ECF subfamily)
MEDQQLIEELKCGNEVAFTLLLSTYQFKVLNICFRFLLHQHDAEDVAQDVFVEVFNSIGTFKSESKLSTWIYRIAVTKSLDELKKRKRKKRITSFGKLLGLEQIAEWVTGIERPDKTLLENEAFEILLSVLNELPESQRIALTLSKIEGYTSAEIAEIMATSITAVDSLIYRAKKQLKINLKLTPDS